MAIKQALLVLALGLALGACGDDPLPVLSSTVTGQYGSGVTFQGVNGFARSRGETFLIAIGEGPLNCDSVDDTEPPDGNNAVMRPPSFDVGTYSGIFVNLYHNVGQFEGKGSNGADVEITASTAESVAGSVSFSFEDKGETYGLNGTFEVRRCP
ncbi:MAG: hypothetical protein KC503_01630 [Myxococcales bacterium]|nr:hypothetical protein [Myxococcales bacterium]